MTELSCTISRTINAPAEDVFNAWLDPVMLAKFMLPGEGVTVPKATADPREGGRFDILMVGEKELPHGGVYQVIKPHSQLVFTWESPFSVDGSTVTLDFEQVAGGTNITLTQVKFLDEQMRDNHVSGWTRILKVLDEVVG